ncbi:MAG: carbon-nitrogen hydrolase [Planctomycetaceae bacterium]|nr:carbon-nitrogen hydrolase [Planctomycetaceae bacterium]
MHTTLRVAQINPALGDLASNLDLHVAEVDQALADGAELILFPELSLTGYFLKDQTAELALPPDAPLFAPLLERSKSISIALGFAERARDGRLYNAVAFLEDGRVLHVHRKVHLVSYGMFDEGRDFGAGANFAAFDSRRGRFGILTCEDFWHLPGPYLYFLQGVDGMLVPSASPARGVTERDRDEDGAARLRSATVWSRLLEARALLTQTFVVYANRVGWEDGIGFGGQSCVFDPFGRELGRLPALESARLTTRLEGSLARRARVQTPLRRDEKVWLLREELARLEREGAIS